VDKFTPVVSRSIKAIGRVNCNIDELIYGVLLFLFLKIAKYAKINTIKVEEQRLSEYKSQIFYLC
jgi:hypothetical protein